MSPSIAAAAAAAAKSLQSCPTLCNPIDGSPPGSPVPGILQARTLEWVAISFSTAWKWKVKVKSLSCVRLSKTPWTAAYQAPPSMGFSRQEYWSGVPSPYPGRPLSWTVSRMIISHQWHKELEILRRTSTKWPVFLGENLHNTFQHRNLPFEIPCFGNNMGCDSRWKTFLNSLRSSWSQI